MEDKGAEGGDWDELSIEVLEMIFRHLPVNDLLSCSVMSKNWKNAARDVLKRYRECYAHIKDFHSDIQALNEMIGSTNLMEMANGLHIRNEMKPKHESGSAPPSSQQAPRSSNVKKFLKKAGEKPKEVKQNIHEVLGAQWRYLTLDMRRVGGPGLTPRDTSLLRKVISATSGSIVKLVIGQVEYWNLIPCHDIEYSNLKVIQLLKNQYLHRNRMRLLSPACAPKLEEISGAMLELEVNNPADRFTMERMKSIMLRPDLEVPQGESKEFFGCLSGLRQLDLQNYHYDPYEEDPEHGQDLLSWQEFVFPLVLRSLDTLEELHMYTVDFCKLFETSQALKFPNLRRLSLASHSRTIIQVEISNLKRLNLAKQCPNLEKVEFSGDDSWVEIQMQLIPLEKCSGLDQSGMPLQIAFDCSDGLVGMNVHEYLKYLNAVYPNITQVRILNLTSMTFLKLGSIIWEMNSLEHLEIQIEHFLTHSDEWRLDALLSGIHMEEVKLLFEGHQERNAVIVPIRPSLFNLKSLKELKLAEGMIRRGKRVTSSLVIHITENLPVRQERKLKVTFEGSKGFCNKMKQLRAFSLLSSAQDPEN